MPIIRNDYMVLLRGLEPRTYAYKAFILPVKLKEHLAESGVIETHSLRSIQFSRLLRTLFISLSIGSPVGSRTQTCGFKAHRPSH